MRLICLVYESDGDVRPDDYAFAAKGRWRLDDNGHEVAPAYRDVVEVRGEFPAVGDVWYLDRSQLSLGVTLSSAGVEVVGARRVVRPGLLWGRELVGYVQVVCRPGLRGW